MIKREHITAQEILRQLPKNYFEEGAFTSEEQEGILLNYAPGVSINYSYDSQGIKNLVKLAVSIDSPVEEEVRRIFTWHLVHKYGFFLSDESRAKIAEAHPKLLDRYDPLYREFMAYSDATDDGRTSPDMLTM